MKIRIHLITLTILLIGVFSSPITAQVKKTNNVSESEIAEYIKWYPAIKQVEMRDAWLKNHKMGEWQFTGAITADDKTVVTPQAGANYGYSWFNISKEPVVITMPKYDKYYSISIFDMEHYMEVIVMPTKPIVVRLPNQKSPIKDAYEIVLQTYQGLAFTRQIMVDNEKEVMQLARKITLTGGGGDFPFVLPSFSKSVQEAGNKKISEYIRSAPNTANFFVSRYEGGGDLDRAAGVMAGQLGTQARYAEYGQLVADQNKKPLNGKDSYQITVPKESLVKNDKGYWTVTIYSIKDRFLIPNKKNIYYISSYNAKPNKDGTYTININADGTGINAIPTNGTDFYGIFRVYEPEANLKFPLIKNVSKK